MLRWMPDRYRELRDLVWGARPDRDVDEELATHVALRAEELEAQGMTAEEARREAQRRFGDAERWRRETLSEAELEQRGRHRTERLDTIRRELRLALRSLARARTFTLIAVLTLALGIGANTAIFSVVNGVLLRPLPVSWLRDLVVVQGDLPGLDLYGTPISVGEALDLAERRDLFQSFTAYSRPTLNLTGAGEPQRIAAVSTVGQFFDVFGARPQLGRLYRAEDSRDGNHKVVVLSHAFWQELTGGDPRVIGTSLRLNDTAFEVIGVLRPDFRYPRTAQLWIPREVLPQHLVPEQRLTLGLTAVARPQPGLTVEQLRGQLGAEAKRWHERYGGQAYEPTAQHTVVAAPFVEFLAGQLRPILRVLMGAVGLVLLISCANVASLQLVRSTGRARELAVRAALGAGRWPLVRQLFAESLALGVAGGVVGLGIGALLIRLIARSDAAQFALLRDVRLDGAVLAFTAVVTLVAAVLFGTIPAVRASDVAAGEVLRGSARGTSAGPARGRFLQGAVVVQVALALVLLLGSGLVVRSMNRLLDADPGFETASIHTMRVALSGARYGDRGAGMAFHDALLERLRAVPGIQMAGMVYGLPFDNLDNSSPFNVVGRAAAADEPKRHARMWYAGGDYFQTMGIALVRGRLFTDADDGNGQVVSVIDETLARQFFPNEDPIGKQIAQGIESTIVGVVRAVKKDDLAEPDKATIYYPFRQTQWMVSNMSVVVRSTLPASATATALRAAVRELDGSIPVFDVMPMAERVERSLGTRRLAMGVLGGFAALALLLSALGVYGVLSYGVSQRTRELGVRLALGARPREVVTMVLRGGLGLTAVGLAVGAVAFLGMGGALGALLYGIGPRDPVTLATGAALLALVAAFGCYIPARRAARVDPITALRAE
ncbi:MAG TPA: ABC transporter permease [Gemmatimonadaceae bacterium]|nr:ABC transporter permease [Gemmatimonadaceae bacterium]